MPVNGDGVCRDGIRGVGCGCSKKPTHMQTRTAERNLPTDTPVDRFLHSRPHPQIYEHDMLLSLRRCRVSCFSCSCIIAGLPLMRCTLCWCAVAGLPLMPEAPPPPPPMPEAWLCRRSLGATGLMQDGWSGGTVALARSRVHVHHAVPPCGSGSSNEAATTCRGGGGRGIGGGWWDWRATPTELLSNSPNQILATQAQNCAPRNLLSALLAYLTCQNLPPTSQTWQGNLTCQSSFPKVGPTCQYVESGS